MIELYHGDCLEVMKQIPDGSVDMVLCDLPYGTTACKWDNVIPFEPLWEQYWRVCKSNAAVVLFGQEPFSSKLRTSYLSRFKYDFIWVKNTQTGINLSKYQPMRKHEIISVFYHEKPTFNKQMQKTESQIMINHHSKGYSRGTKKTKSEHTGNMQLNRENFSDMINPSSVLKFDVVPNRALYKLHPTQKPVALMEYLIKTYTNEGETVLDNCMGSGTTGVACKNLNRRFIGIEKELEYFEIAKKRIDET